MTGDAARIEFVGHATIRMEIGGVRLITDPILRNRLAHLRRAEPIDPAPLTPVDAVLISHAHLDHLDIPSLRRLGGATRIVVPRGLGRWMRGRGFADVAEMGVGERLRIGEVQVEATFADHDGSRGPMGPRGKALGYAVLGSRRLLFMGDTGLFDAMEGMIPDLDVALVPIWGWGPSLGRHKHLGPESAAEAIRRLAPRVAVPMHWGTLYPAHLGLRQQPAFLRHPPAAFVTAMAGVAPGVEVRVLRPGEATEV